MPFKSIAQQRYFNTHKAALEAKGVDVPEWNAASTGLTLPKRVKAPAKRSLTLGQAQQMRAKTYKLGR